ncbi:MAG: electron transfer flavoprotein subunit beta/FixA family protein [bacterium]|nr:electron transfer flavoprotein subunit beta/FixA family protein [bacterium]
MNIIVCVKQVPIITTRSGIDPATNRLLPGELVYTLNPHDEAAVEEALVIREKHGGTVTVLTFGPARAEEALRWCLAMGADEAIHIVEEAPPEMSPFAVSIVLAAVIRELEYDLILFGKLAIDDEMGLTGTFVAELMDLPVVTTVVRVELHPGERRAILHRSLGKGDREVAECCLPAVFTIDMQMNRPRYPTLGGRRMAERREIRAICMKKEGGMLPCREKIPAVEILRRTPPKIRPKKILAPDENESAASRMRWIMSGGMVQKRGGRITGDADRLAEGIVEYLVERNFISRSH